MCVFYVRTASPQRRSTVSCPSRWQTIWALAEFIVGFVRPEFEPGPWWNYSQALLLSHLAQDQVQKWATELRKVSCQALFLFANVSSLHEGIYNLFGIERSSSGCLIWQITIGGHRHRSQCRRYPISDIDICYSDIGDKYVGPKNIVPISEVFRYRHQSSFRYPTLKKKYTFSCRIKPTSLGMVSERYNIKLLCLFM